MMHGETEIKFIGKLILFVVPWVSEFIRFYYLYLFPDFEEVNNLCWLLLYQYFISDGDGLLKDELYCIKISQISTAWTSDRVQWKRKYYGGGNKYLEIRVTVFLICCLVPERSKLKREFCVL